MFVIDASVYVAVHSDGDRHHSRCLRWLERCLEEQAHLVAPVLLAAEVAAAIRRLTRKPDEAERVVSDLLEDGVVELVPLSRDGGRLAAEVAVTTGVRGADAVYIALARELDAALVTLDRQQLERGRQVATVRRP